MGMLPCCVTLCVQWHHIKTIAVRYEPRLDFSGAHCCMYLFTWNICTVSVDTVEQPRAIYLQHGYDSACSSGYLDTAISSRQTRQHGRWRAVQRSLYETIYKWNNLKTDNILYFHWGFSPSNPGCQLPFVNSGLLLPAVMRILYSTQSYEKWLRVSNWIEDLRWHHILQKSIWSGLEASLWTSRADYGFAVSPWSCYIFICVRVQGLSVCLTSCACSSCQSQCQLSALCNHDDIHPRRQDDCDEGTAGLMGNNKQQNTNMFHLCDHSNL